MYISTLPEGGAEVNPYTIYRELLACYGPQGWWPITACTGTNPAASGTRGGYHPGDYSWPRTPLERFEICIGAVLTQNTAWSNVEKALANLAGTAAVSPEGILSLPREELAALIRPAGYFNQKSAYLHNLAIFLSRCGNATPSRADLLAVTGIGEETADSILLYAYKVPTFVVDAYTRRIFGHRGLIDPASPYKVIKAYFEEGLPQDPDLFAEYHALIVEHAKRYYSKKPHGLHDPLIPRPTGIL